MPNCVDRYKPKRTLGKDPFKELKVDPSCARRGSLLGRQDEVEDVLTVGGEGLGDEEAKEEAQGEPPPPRGLFQRTASMTALSPEQVNRQARPCRSMRRPWLVVLA